MTTLSDNLRPLSIAELFDRSFRLYRNNFAPFLGIIVLTQIPLYLFQIVLTALTGSTADLNEAIFADSLEGTAVAAGITAAIIGFIFTQIGTATLTKAASDSYLGRTIQFRDAFQRIGGTWFTLIFANIVAGLVVAGLALPLFCAFSLFISPVNATGFLVPTAIIGFLGFLIVAAIGNMLISLVAPVVVLEKKGVLDSVKRAWALAKLRFWWVFGYLLLLGLLSLLVIEGPATLLLVLIETVLGDTNIILQTIVQQSANLVLTAVFLPIRLAAITLMYFDLRVRFEGFDLMVLASAADEFTKEASDLTSQTTL